MPICFKIIFNQEIGLVSKWPLLLNRIRNGSPSVQTEVVRSSRAILIAFLKVATRVLCVLEITIIVGIYELFIVIYKVHDIIT